VGFQTLRLPPLDDKTPNRLAARDSRGFFFFYRFWLSGASD